MFSGTIFRRNEENFKKIFEGRFLPVDHDFERYDMNNLYREETDYADGYDTDDSDYITDDEEDENALWDDEEAPVGDDSDEPPVKKRRKRTERVAFSDDSDGEDSETEENEKARRSLAQEQRLIEELEVDAQEHPIEDDGEDTDEQPERKLLRRELRAQALKRLEDSARTLSDYENLVSWYDRLDANRERRERYHELSRSGDDVPLDYGASANELYFPDYLNHVLEKQIRKGDFLDAIFNCPYDIHELVTDDDLCIILRELNEDHKELLYLCAIRLFSSTKIAAIRGQSDRNIRKVRGTMLKKIRKKLLAALTGKVQKKQPLTLLEKEFLIDNGAAVE